MSFPRTTPVSRHLARQPKHLVKLSLTTDAPAATAAAEQEPTALAETGATAPPDSVMPGGIQ